MALNDQLQLLVLCRLNTKFHIDSLFDNAKAKIKVAKSAPLRDWILRFAYMRKHHQELKIYIERGFFLLFWKHTQPTPLTRAEGSVFTQAKWV